MSIRGLERFLRSNNLLKKGNLEVLSNCVLAFDALEYFQQAQLLKGVEHLALGGLPSDLTDRVDTIVAQLRAVRITPIFIFPGLTGRGNRSDAFLDNCASAWSAADKGRFKTANKNFADAGGWTDEVERAVLAHLRRSGVRSWRAPCRADAQLGWLGRKGAQLVHGCVGGLSLILMKAQTIITEIDWKAQTVDWVDIAEVEASLGMDFGGVRDLCLLAGYRQCRTFPAFARHKPFTFQHCYQQFAVHKDTETFFTHYESDQEAKRHRPMFDRMNRSLQEALVLTPQCSISPLEEGTALDSVTVLPRHVYIRLSQGRLSPTLVFPLLNGRYNVPAPVVDTRELTIFLNQLTPIRARVLGWLATALNRNGMPDKTFNVVEQRWFESKSSRVLLRGPSDSEAPAINTDGYTDLACSLLFSSDGKGGEDHKQIQAWVNQHDPSHELSLPLISAIFLLRVGALDGARLSFLTRKRNKTFFASGSNMRAISLLSRVFALAPFSTRVTPGLAVPADRTLGGFSAFQRSLHRVLREAVEVCLLSAQFASEQQGEEGNEKEPVVQLPSGVGLGLLAHHWLSGSTSEELQAKFPQASRITEDLRLGATLWGMVNTYVQENVDDENFKREFSSANDLLSTCLSTLPVPEESSATPTESEDATTTTSTTPQ